MLITHQGDVIVGHPFQELEGACPHRMRPALLLRHLFKRRGGGHGEPQTIASDHQRKHVVGLLQHEAHCVRIDHFHRLHILVEDAGKRSGLGVHHMVEIPLHRLGVHIRAIVDFHPFLQIKGIGQPIRTHLPALRQVRHWFQVFVQGQEGIVDIHIDPHHLIPWRRLYVKV